MVCPHSLPRHACALLCAVSSVAWFAAVAPGQQSPPPLAPTRTSPLPTPTQSLSPPPPTRTPPLPTPTQTVPLSRFGAAALAVLNGGASAGDCFDAARRLYASRAFEPVWTQAGAPTRQAAEVIAAIGDATRHGLEPADYGVDELRVLHRRLGGPDAAASLDEAPRFDVALSVAAACFADHLHRGRVRPRRVGFDLDGRSPLDVAARLAAVADSSDAGAALEAVAPARPEYRWLLPALARVRGLAGRGTLAGVPALPKLEPGDVDAAVPRLRARLRDLGDDAAAPADGVGPAASNPEVYDDALVAAVRRFQNRHGLAEDGIVGPRTLAALQVPIEARVRQIELALERWRWLPRPDRRSIVVNVPEFRVRLHEPGVDPPVLAMKTVVGSAANKTRTVVFSAEMKNIVFRPFWHLPRSIAVGEMLPAARRDPGYLARRGIQVLGDAPLSAAALASGAVRLRQKPGGNNSLGLIKFLFPNRYNIYMHDTPAKGLFARSRRDFSHGCIRLEDAEALATRLLADQGWDAERVAAATRGGDSRWVSLDTPVPVAVFYVTAVAAPDGTTWFYEDIYGHDQELARALRSAARNVPRIRLEIQDVPG